MLFLPPEQSRLGVFSERINYIFYSDPNDLISLVTVAIIDDDKNTVDVFIEYLEIFGIKVVAVGYNGKDAVDIYKKYKPDITFLDLRMPEYDGIYALSEIRNLDPNANVIIVTAELGAKHSEKLDSLKPTDVFTKPFNMEQIQLAIKRITATKIHTVEHDKEKKALVSITITNVLDKMSPSATNEVGDRLYAKYHCYFSDCLEHPEYLRDILTEIFGNGALVVMNAIRNGLAEFEDQQPISNFLLVLSK